MQYQTRVDSYGIGNFEVAHILEDGDASFDMTPLYIYQYYISRVS